MCISIWFLSYGVNGLLNPWCDCRKLWCCHCLCPAWQNCSTLSASISQKRSSVNTLHSGQQHCRCMFSYFFCCAELAVIVITISYSNGSIKPPCSSTKISPLYSSGGANVSPRLHTAKGISIGSSVLAAGFTGVTNWQTHTDHATPSVAGVCNGAYV